MKSLRRLLNNSVSNNSAAAVQLSRTVLLNFISFEFMFTLKHSKSIVFCVNVKNVKCERLCERKVISPRALVKGVEFLKLRTSSGL